MRRDAVIRDPKTAEPIPEVKIPGLIPNGEGRCTYCLAHRDKLPPGETFHWAKDCPRRDQWATRGAAASRTQPHDADERKVVSVDGVEFALCWCPPGSFTMGSGNGDSDERPTIRVIVPNGFWMGETEVTQELWRKVMGDGIKPYNDKGGSYPMENISWNDCVQFVKKLNERADVKSRDSDGGAVGICLSCRRKGRLRSDEGRCRRAARRHGMVLVQQRTRDSFRDGTENAERVGALRYARQCVGVVRQCVSESAGRKPR